MKGLRQAVNRVARYGYTVRFLDPAHLDAADAARMAELMAKSRRGEQERGFSMMLGRLFDRRDTGLMLTLVEGPDGAPVAMCQFVPSPAIGGYSLDLMRRDPGEHPNGLLDFALCSTIDHLKEMGMKGLSLNFAALRSVLEGDNGDGVTQRVERWALRRLSGVLQIETLWRFNAKYEPRLAAPLHRLRLGRAVRARGRADHARRVPDRGPCDRPPPHHGRGQAVGPCRARRGPRRAAGSQRGAEPAGDRSRSRDRPAPRQ